MHKNNRSESRCRNVADSRGRAQLDQKVKALSERNKAEAAKKTSIDMKELKRTDSKMSRPTELKKTRSTTDLISSGRIKNQSAALENLSKANRVKDCLMEAIRWMSLSHPFDKSPFRCAVLRAHYNWSASMFFVMFFYAVSTYYGEEPIRCVDHYDRTKADKTVLDICVQFPFTTKNSQPFDYAKRYYATSYMWLHWGCALLMLIFKLVQVAVYLLENKCLRRFLETLQKNIDYNYRVYLVRQYFQENYGNHRGLVMKVMILHVIALSVNVGVFFILDFFMNFKYLYLPRFLLIQRDFTNFDDEYSLMFPPFVRCEISPDLHIQMGRTNWYGCHLPLMEFYEKIFMMIWFWQVFLACWTVISLFSWGTYLCMKKQRLDGQELFRKESRNKHNAGALPIDEVVVLNLVKNFMFGQHYRALLRSLVNWNPHTTQLDIPINEYRINYPYVLRGLSALVDEDLEAFFEELQHDVPVSLREEAYASKDAVQNFSMKFGSASTSKHRPSAPVDTPSPYETVTEKGHQYGGSSKSSNVSDSGVRTPSTVPMAREQSDDSSDEEL